LSDVGSDVTVAQAQVPVFKQMVDASTQTILDGTTVSRCLTAVDIMANVLDKVHSDQITEGTVKIVKTFTD
jgi:hypothetical protein